MRVEASARPNGVEITVHNTGKGFIGPDPTKNGVGLDNVAKRLDLCYGPQSSLRIESDADGTTASFFVPSTALPMGVVEAAS